MVFIDGGKLLIQQHRQQIQFIGRRRHTWSTSRNFLRQTWSIDPLRPYRPDHSLLEGPAANKHCHSPMHADSGIYTCRDVQSEGRRPPGRRRALCRGALPTSVSLDDSFSGDNVMTDLPGAARHRQGQKPTSSARLPSFPVKATNPIPKLRRVLGA